MWVRSRSRVVVVVFAAAAVGSPSLSGPLEERLGGGDGLVVALGDVDPEPGAGDDDGVLGFGVQRPVRGVDDVADSPRFLLELAREEDARGDDALGRGVRVRVASVCARKRNVLPREK